MSVALDGGNKESSQCRSEPCDRRGFQEGSAVAECQPFKRAADLRLSRLQMLVDSSTFPAVRSFQFSFRTLSILFSLKIKIERIVGNAR